jgi:hypothetical protein
MPRRSAPTLLGLAERTQAAHRLSLWDKSTNGRKVLATKGRPCYSAYEPGLPVIRRRGKEEAGCSDRVCGEVLKVSQAGQKMLTGTL